MGINSSSLTLHLLVSSLNFVMTLTKIRSMVLGEDELTVVYIFSIVLCVGLGCTVSLTRGSVHLLTGQGLLCLVDLCKTQRTKTFTPSFRDKAHLHAVLPLLRQSSPSFDLL